MNPRRRTQGAEWGVRAASLALVLFASACGPVIALLDQHATSVAATGLAVIAGTRDQRATMAAATVRAVALGTPVPVPGRPTQTPYVTRAPTVSVLGQHRVESGETLYCIARAYGVAPSAIVAANGLSLPDQLTPGTVLIIPLVPWTEIPPGPACAAQFASPFVAPGSPATVVPTVGPTPRVDPFDTRKELPILIVEPGQGSRLTSPVRVSGWAAAPFEATLVVGLYDGDPHSGRVIAVAPAIVNAPPGERGPFSVDIAFDPAFADPAGEARVYAYATSPRDGGVTALGAGPSITLLAPGSAASPAPSDVNPAQTYKEPFTINAVTTTSGAASITGYSRYVFESSLGVAVCGGGGAGAPDFFCGAADNVLYIGALSVLSPDLGLPGPLDGAVTYRVAAATPGRIVVFETSPRDGALIYLTTFEVLLQP